MAGEVRRSQPQDLPAGNGLQQQLRIAQDSIFHRELLVQLSREAFGSSSQLVRKIDESALTLEFPPHGSLLLAYEPVGIPSQVSLRLETRLERLIKLIPQMIYRHVQTANLHNFTRSAVHHLPRPKPRRSLSVFSATMGFVQQETNFQRVLDVIHGACLAGVERW